MQNFQALHLHLLTESNYWVFFQNNTILPEYVPVSSHFYVVSLQESYKFVLTALFQYSPDKSDFSSNNLGVWSPKQGWEEYIKLSLPGDRLDLNGTSLRVAYYYSSKESLLHLNDFR